MDVAKLVDLIGAANALGARGDADLVPRSLRMRGAAVRVGGVLTRRLIVALVGKGSISLDLSGLSGLSDLTRNLDGLLVKGDGLPNALTDTDIGLVWTLRNEIVQSMAAYPDGNAMMASIDRSPAAQTARGLAEASAVRMSGMQREIGFAEATSTSDGTAQQEPAAMRASSSPPAANSVDIAKEQAPVANGATTNSFGLLSRALMHLHDVIGGKVAPDAVAVPEKSDPTLQGSQKQPSGDAAIRSRIQRAVRTGQP